MFNAQKKRKKRKHKPFLKSFILSDCPNTDLTLWKTTLTCNYILKEFSDLDQCDDCDHYK